MNYMYMNYIHIYELCVSICIYTERESARGGVGKDTVLDRRIGTGIMIIHSWSIYHYVVTSKITRYLLLKLGLI